MKSQNTYKLKDFRSETHQEVRFTGKNPDGSFNVGTTNEEVVQMMIDRMYSLQEVSWSPENAVVIILFKQIRTLFAKRLSKKVSKVLKHQSENRE